jgi:protein lysine acetyltransferase
MGVIEHQSNPGPDSDPDSARWLVELDGLAVAAVLEHCTYRPGEVLVRQGEAGNFFLIVTEGEATVDRSGHPIATAGPGSVVGELSLLTGVPRTTTVTAKTTMICRRGTGYDFAELLESDHIREYFSRLAAARLAANTTAVPFSTAAGFQGEIRPLLPTDKEAYVKLLGGFSKQSRRLRFFSTAVPSQRLIDYFVNIDFIDHFAWVVLDTSVTPHQGCAVARFIRDESDIHRAEAAFAVTDAYHGNGIGTILFGALAVAASTVGITMLTADVLEENNAMRRVFNKADPLWTHADRGVLQARMSVDAIRALTYSNLDAALSASVQGIGIAAEIGLR